MTRIVLVFAFAALLAACSGSNRVEDILRANAPRHSTTQFPKSHLDNRSTPELETTRVMPEATPQEPPKSTPQSTSEE
jgi:hypothetical protein